MIDSPRPRYRLSAMMWVVTSPRPRPWSPDPGADTQAITCHRSHSPTPGSPGSADKDIQSVLWPRSAAPLLTLSGLIQNEEFIEDDFNLNQWFLGGYFLKSPASVDKSFKLKSHLNAACWAHVWAQVWLRCPFSILNTISIVPLNGRGYAGRSIAGVKAGSTERRNAKVERFTEFWMYFLWLGICLTISTTSEN